MGNIVSAASAFRLLKNYLPAHSTFYNAASISLCSFADAARMRCAEAKFEPANAEDAEREEIDHHAHYAGEIECIDALLETMGRDDVRAFCLCNAFKCLWRCKKKHDTPTEDVKKAAWYLQKYLELDGKS